MSEQQRSYRANQQVCGELAQLGEHLPCTQGVAGSIPVFSTINIPFLYGTECYDSTLKTEYETRKRKEIEGVRGRRTLTASYIKVKMNGNVH